MVVSCSIVGCSNKQGKSKGVRFFGIPTVIKNQCSKTLNFSRRRRAEWLARINQKNITDISVGRYTKVCSRHFVQGCPAPLFDPTNQDWAPSLYLGDGNFFENRITIPEQPPDASGLYNVKGTEHLDSLSGDSVPGDSLPGDPLFVAPGAFDCKDELILGETVNIVPVIPCEPEENAVKSETFTVGELTVKSEDFTINENAVKSETFTVGETTVKSEDFTINENTVESEDFYVGEGSATKSEISSIAKESEVCELPKLEVTFVPTSVSCDEIRSESDPLIQEVGLSESSSKVESILFQRLVKKNSGGLKKVLKVKEVKKKIKHVSTNLEDRCEEVNPSFSKFSLNEESLKGDNEKVELYTGLPSYALLMLVFSLVSERVDSAACALPKFEQFLMVLVWLRLGLDRQDLADQFGVSQLTVTRILNVWLAHMSYSLEKCIFWSNREALLANMPRCFQDNWDKSVAVIVDSFEVKTRNGEHPHCRPRVGLPSENHPRVKFVLGVTLQGSVLFISKANVGNASDTYISEHCGILYKLLPGDIVFAGQGFNFNIGVAKGIVGAKIPGISEGKSQLIFEDLELTRKVDNVRIHVKRLIGLVCRRFQILESTLPVNLLTNRPGDELAPIDHIARVCCALSNLCLPIVPME